MQGGTPWLITQSKRATGSGLITEVCTRTTLKIGWVGAWIWMSGQADLTKHEGKIMRLKAHHGGLYEDSFEDWMGVAVYDCRGVPLG